MSRAKGGPEGWRNRCDPTVRLAAAVLCQRLLEYRELVAAQGCEPWAYSHRRDRVNEREKFLVLPTTQEEVEDRLAAVREQLLEENWTHVLTGWDPEALVGVIDGDPDELRGAWEEVS